ncbi:MAG: Gfo/Idh/MocA family protein [Eubacteriales bacterium]
MNITKIDKPVRIAIIGAGNRSSTIYQPLFNDLKPWIDICAVCDPVIEHADKMAQAVGAKAYYDIHKLVEDRPMEAAIVITPVDSHHSISIYLSENGIHNMVETTWCNTQRQAREMIKKAEEKSVITAVSENFFRFAIDRFSNRVRESGYIGKIGRIFSYNDHTGYHNNSRWIHFAGAHPLWVQSIEHTMSTIEFTAPPARHYDSETFKARYYMFPDNLMVIDNASNIKGFLGRHTRPGYTEWQGESGTLVHRGYDKWQWETFLRKPYKDVSNPNVTPVLYDIQNERFFKASAETPEGTIEYINPYVPQNICEHINKPFYGCAIMDEMIEFAFVIRGIKKLEFTAKDAMMSLTMDLAASQSAACNGERVNITDKMDFEVERSIEAGLRKQYGVDPYDIEGMLALSYPRK